MFRASRQLFSPEGLSPALEEANLADGDIETNIEIARRILYDYGLAEFHADLALTPLERRPKALTQHDRIGHGRIKRLLAQGAINSFTGLPAYTVWEHTYLTPPANASLPVSHSALERHRQEGERWHNHTGPIISRLEHGFIHAGERRRTTIHRPTLLTPEDTHEWNAFAADLRPTEAIYTPDDRDQQSVMSLDPDELHRLQKIGKDTISVIIKFPTRNFSLLFGDYNHDPDKPLTVYKALPSGILAPDKVPVDERAIPDIPRL